MVDQDADLSKYSCAVIYPADKASFVELELMDLFRKQGYKIVGEKEMEKEKTMGVRYTYETVHPYYVITCVIIDTTTEKTLASIEAKGGKFDLWSGHTFPNKQKAKEVLLEEIQKVLPRTASAP